MDGDGGGGDGFGGDGWGAADADAGLGLAGGAGLIMTGGVLGALGNLVPPTPGSPPTAAAQRALLTEYKQMVADGLITEADYDALKAKTLGIEGTTQ